MLSAEQDEVFRANMYENYGDVGMNIGRLVGQLQETDERNKKVQSLGE